MKRKTALITGASRGIGRAIATAFARAGCNIVITCSKSEQELLELQAGLETKYAVDVLASIGDISDYQYVEHLFSHIAERFHGVDILINNAGMYPAMMCVDVTEKHFDRVLNVNLKGTFFVTQAVVNQSMIPNNYGRIVNISSCDGKAPASGVAIYGAAKAGVISLTKSFALELADYDINSNCVAPGWVESEAVLSGDRWKTYLPQIPSRRLGKLSEIAESCVFLCNDKVSYINGEILDVNGAIIMD